MAFRRKPKDSENGSFQKRTAWTAEEDALLTQQVAIYGTHSWPEVATAMTGRTSKACSLRWRCFLSPHIIRPNDEPFSQWEVAVIVLTQRVFGNKWNDIASYLPMRCNNDIKNYFNLYLKDKEQQVYSDNFFLRSGYELSHLLNDEPADVAERRKKLDEEKGPAAGDASKLSRPLTAAVRKPATPVAGKPKKASGASAGGVAGIKGGGVAKGAAKRVAASAAALSAAMLEDYAAYYSSSDGSYVAAAAAAAAATYGSPGQVVGSYYCGEGDVMAAYAGSSAAAAAYAGGLDASGAAAAAGVYAGSFTAGSMTDSAAGAAPGYNMSGGQYGTFSLASAGGSGLHVAHDAAQQQQPQQHRPADGQHDTLTAAAPLPVPAANGYGSSSSSSLFLQQQEAALNAYGATCFTTATPASTHEAPGNGAAAGACDAVSKGSAGGGAAIMGLLRPSDDAAGSPLLCPGSIGNRLHFLPEGSAALSADPIAAARHTFWKPLTDGISPGDASLLLEDDPTHDDVIAEFAAYEDADNEPTASLGAQQHQVPGGSLGSRPGSTASASSGALHAMAAGAEAKSPESAASLQTAGGGGAAGATSSDACCNMQQDSPISAAVVAAALAVGGPHQQAQQLHEAMQVESKACQAGAAAAGSSPVPASPASPPQPLASAFDSYHSPAPTAGSARRCTNLRLGLLNPALSHVVGGGDRNALSAPCTVPAAYTPNGSWQQSTLPVGAFTQGVGSQQHEAGWAHHQQQVAAGVHPSQMHTPFTNLHHQQQQLQEMCSMQYNQPWGGPLHHQHTHMGAADHYAARAYASSHSSHQQAMHLPLQLQQQQAPSPSSATATAIASGGFNSPPCLATPNSWTSCSRQAQSALRPSAAATVGAEHSSRAASWAQHGTRGAAASDDSEAREADGQLWGIKAEGSTLDGAGHVRTEPAHHAVGGATAPHAGIRLSDDDGCLGRVWDSFDGSHLHDTIAGDDHAVKLVHNAVRWGSTSLGRLSEGW